MTVNASRAQPVAKNAARRSNEPHYPVWGPDGRMEMHPRHVVNDLVRFGTVEGKWYASDPVELAKQLPAHLLNPQMKQAHQAAATAAEDAPDGQPVTATPRLTALRTEIATLGGTYHPSWGTRSLEAHLAAVKAELAKQREFAVKDPTMGLTPAQVVAAAEASVAEEQE